MLNIPTLKTPNHEINNAFRVAIGDFMGNIVNYQGGLNHHPCPTIIAGLDYVTPWTRDAAFNTWYAGGIISPEAAKNTLRSVLEHRPEGLRIIGEYWDSIIWAFGAWQYYLYTGDKEFLTEASEAVENSLTFFEQTEQDTVDGLFRGGACFQDGIAAYPDKFVSKNFGSGIMSCLEDNPDFLVNLGVGIPTKALSTNALYLLAYQCAQQMRQELGKTPSLELAQRAEKLQKDINQHFYNPTAKSYRYLLDADDPIETRQEGLGSAFVILSQAADKTRREEVFASQYITKHGIPCVWPQYDRYAVSPGTYARHSGLIWPQVNAAWAYALALYGHANRAYEELLLLAQKAARDTVFYEIYHPESGLPYGGLQEDTEVNGIREWASCRRQTWCAGGFINMVLTTLFGLRFAPDGLRFEPYLPLDMPKISIESLNYRNAILNIEIERTGLNCIECNGNATSLIPANATGELKIKIQIK